MKNLSEKSSQVRLMTEVYNGAEQVCIWLGTADGSDEDRRRLESHEETFVYYRMGISPMEEHRAQLRYLSKAMMDKPFSQHEFRELDAVFDRRFWKGSWIVQEVVVVAKEVIVRLGDEEIDWDDIADVRQLYDLRAPPTLEDYVAIRVSDMRITGGIGPYPFHLGWAAVETLQYLRKKYQNGQELTLPELPNPTRYHYSSDARDKIFAIFSLSPPAEMSHELIQPDYSLSLSEVYTRAAEYILEVYRNLDILSICQPIRGNYGTQ